MLRMNNMKQGGAKSKTSLKLETPLYIYEIWIWCMYLILPISSDLGFRPEGICILLEDESPKT